MFLSKTGDYFQDEHGIFISSRDYSNLLKACANTAVGIERTWTKSLDLGIKLVRVELIDLSHTHIWDIYIYIYIQVLKGRDKAFIYIWWKPCLDLSRLALCHRVIVVLTDSWNTEGILVRRLRFNSRRAIRHTLSMACGWGRRFSCRKCIDLALEGCLLECAEDCTV